MVIVEIHYRSNHLNVVYLIVKMRTHRGPRTPKSMFLRHTCIPFPPYAQIYCPDERLRSVCSPGVTVQVLSTRPTPRIENIESQMVIVEKCYRSNHLNVI